MAETAGNPLVEEGTSAIPGEEEMRYGGGNDETATSSTVTINVSDSGVIGTDPSAAAASLFSSTDPNVVSMTGQGADWSAFGSFPVNENGGDQAIAMGNPDSNGTNVGTMNPPPAGLPLMQVINGGGAGGSSNNNGGPHQIQFTIASAEGIEGSGTNLGLGDSNASNNNASGGSSSTTTSSNNNNSNNVQPQPMRRLQLHVPPGARVRLRAHRPNNSATVVTRNGVASAAGAGAGIGPGTGTAAVASQGGDNAATTQQPQPPRQQHGLQMRREQRFMVVDGARRMQQNSAANGRMGNVTFINGNRAGGNNIHVNLPPLMPSVLPDAQQNLRTAQEQILSKSGKTDDKDSAVANGFVATAAAASTTKPEPTQVNLERFHCGICWEFMKDPVGCGHDDCSTRFCWLCLHKALQQSRSNSNPTNGRTAGQMHCPLCRKEVKAVKRDVPLRQALERLGPIRCRFAGCPERLALSAVSVHESTCPHVKVSCRYSTVGCAWTGKRGQLDHHLQHHCALAKVAPLVDMTRAVREEYRARLGLLQGRLQATQAALEAQGRVVRQHQTVNTSNIFHVLQFVALQLCTTPQFLQLKDQWNVMFALPEGRAAVFNLLALLPTYVLVFKTNVIGYRNLVAIFSSHGLSFYQNDKALDAFADQATRMLSAAFGVTIAFCFGVDWWSSRQWQYWGAGGQQQPQQTVVPYLPRECWFRHAVAASFVCLNALELDVERGSLPVVMQWIWTVLATIMIPAVVTAVSLAASKGPRQPQPTVENCLDAAGRAEPLVQFGLCYSLLLVKMGLLPACDAVALYWMGRNDLATMAMFQKDSGTATETGATGDEDSSFVSRILKRAIHADMDGFILADHRVLTEANCRFYLATRLVVKVGEIFLAPDNWLSSTVEPVFAVLGLVGIKLSFQAAAFAATQLGLWICLLAKQDQQMVVNQFGASLRRPFSFLGSAVFFGSIYLLALIWWS